MVRAYVIYSLTIVLVSNPTLPLKRKGVVYCSEVENEGYQKNEIPM